jgi:hypothetical protein
MQMTSEEQFTKIENYHGAVAEHQARRAEHQSRYDEDIRELRQLNKSCRKPGGKA